jgi:hypothetical protein
VKNINITTLSGGTPKAVYGITESDIFTPIYIDAVEDNQYILTSDSYLNTDSIKIERHNNDLAISFGTHTTLEPQILIQNFFTMPSQLLASTAPLESSALNWDTTNYKIIVDSTQSTYAETQTKPEASSTAQSQIFEKNTAAVEIASYTTKPSSASIKPEDLNNLTTPHKPVIDKITDDVGQADDVTIAQNGGTNDTTPTLHGTGEYGQYVSIYANNNFLGKVRVKPSGKWNFTPTTPLQDGEYSFTIQVTNPDGSLSAISDSYLVAIDTRAPDQPNIKNIYDDHGNQTGFLSSNSHTSDSRPDIYGRGEPNTTVVIHDNGKVIGEALVNETGSWSFTPSIPLSDGQHNLTVISVDAAGNESWPSEDFIFTVDTTPPAPPVITSLYDDAGNVKGEVQLNGITDDNTPIISGKAEPGSTITILLDGSAWDIITIGEDGLWSYTPDVPFSDGTHSLTAYATDKVGNKSAMSDAFTFSIDSTVGTISILGATDNAGSITGVIPSGGLTDDATPTLTGRATPGCIVKIYDGETLIDQTKANGIGSWAFTPTLPLSDGSHSLTATVTTPGGGESLPTAPFEIVVDATAPEKPVVESIYDTKGQITGEVAHNGVTDDAMPLISGIAEPNSQVTILDNGLTLDIVDVDANGNWSFTPILPFVKGTHSLSVIATDAAGNSSEESEAFVFEVDTSIPTVSINGAFDNAGSVTGSILPGSVTDDATPTLNGRATANAAIKIYNGSTLIGETVVSKAGNWSFTPPFDLVDGVYNFTATVSTDAYGESAPTPIFNLEIDTTAPELPESGHFIDSILDDVGTITGNVVNGKPTDDTTPTLIGRAEPNSTVNIYDNNVFLGSAKVDASGNWSFTPEVPLADGQHSFTVTNEDQQGNTSQESEPYIITVDTEAPKWPEDGDSPIGEIIDGTGNVTGPIEDGSTTDENQPVLSGEGNPGETITIIDNGDEIGKVIVDEDGKWTFTPEEPLEDGNHDIDIIITDEAGNSSDPIDGIEIVVDTSPSQAPTLDGVYDDQGTLTGPVGKNGLTDDARPTVTGTAKAGSTVSLYSGDTLLGTAVADANGNWSITASVDLEDGLNNLTATSTNAAGNESPRTEAFPINVDTQAPSAASEVTLSDDVGQIQNAIKPGASTDDNTPTLGGKAEPGSTVVIFDNGSEVGRATVDDQGTWSFTPSTPLPDGDHSLSTQVIDAAGNESERSEAIDFNVDTRTPEVSITAVNDNVGSKTGDLLNNAATDDSTPTISGHATAGGTVSIYSNGELLGTVKADTDGNWSFTPQAPLQDGLYNLTATVTTEAHGESTATDAFTITVDTVSPTLPEGGEAIDEILDNSGAVTGPIENGTTTDEDKPTFNGSANPGDIITIVDNGKPIGEVQVDENGNWTFTPEQPLEDGSHNIGIIITDEAGNSSDLLGDYNFTVDSSVSNTPTIDKVLDNVGQTGLLASGDVTDDAKPTLTGTADPNSTVVIFNKGSEIGRVSADSGGNWSFEPDLPLLNGEHVLTVMGINTNGKDSALSDGFVINVMVGGVPNAPAITAVKDDTGEYTGALQKEDLTDDTRPTVEGTAIPGYIVSVYSNGVLLGTTTSNSSGFWSFTPDFDLDDGIHRLSATSRNGEGPESVSTGAFTIEVDTVAPVKPVITSVFDDHGETQHVNPNGITDDNRPTFSGKSEAYDLITIKDGNITLGVSVANGDGEWTFTPGKALSDGTHNISVTAQDEAGNTSVTSDTYTFTVNTQVPLAAATLEVESGVEVATGIDIHEPLLPVSLGDVLSDVDTALFSEPVQAETQTPAQLSLESMLSESGDIQAHYTVDGIAADSYSQPVHIEEELLA